MPRLEWRLTRFPCRLWYKLKETWQLIKLFYYTLCFNSFTTWSSTLEASMEPMFWFVDRFARYLGPIFVTLVVCLTTSVVVIFYLCILPDIFSRSFGWTVFHLVFGHWLLVNIVFHYVMAAFTHPGKPPSEIPQTVSLCKKCISPKPPRTHHCSVCAVCILKMDHHCPWLNNCVGFFNHRYFFLFCVYMWIGTVYVSVTGYDLFREHFYGPMEPYFPGALYPLNMAHHLVFRNKMEDLSLFQNQSAFDGKTFPSGHMIEDDWTAAKFIHSCVIFEFLLCSGVVIALGLLTMWHARLIALGQTSIEVHINKKERKRLKAKGMIFKNPYDFGFKRNWEIFLGLEDGRTFFKNILFPSMHSPYGEGLIWQRSTYEITDDTTAVTS